jgi:hypothetical protein
LVSLASAAKRLARRALQEVAQIVRPETILSWRQDRKLVLQLARENRSWGYRRIVGALRNLGHEVSHQTVANVLKRHDISPAPERRRTMSWREFIRSHMEVLGRLTFSRRRSGRWAD